MRKMIFALGILLAYLSSASIAYAGSLNQYEQDVIAAAKAQYVYDGKKYVLDPAYINMIIDYLSEDDRDWTKDQRDTVIQSISTNIETGVEDGYLIPVDGTQENAGDPGTGESDSDDSGSLPNQGDDTTGHTGQADANDDSQVIQPDDNQKENNNDTSGQTQNFSEDTTGNDFLGIILSGLLSEEIKQGGDSSDASGEINKSNIDNDAIKATGFNFNNTFIIAAVIGVIMLTGMLVTIKSNYFAHNDE